MKCRFVLSFDAFNETLQEGEQSKRRLEELETRLKQTQEQAIEQMNAKLATTQDQVTAMLEMLTSVSKEEAATTGSKKDFLLRKLGVLTNGKIGEDPNDPSIVIEPVNSSPRPCIVCGEKASAVIKTEIPAKYTTAFKERLSSSLKQENHK